MRFLIIAILTLYLFSTPAYCEYKHEQGKIAIAFKSDVSEEDAVDFVKKINLEIVIKGSFGPPSIHFNIESGLDSFIREIHREPIVNSVYKGERLKIDDREGNVVRIKFRPGTGLDQIEELSLKYRKREGVIAWRYYKSELPFIVVKVPVGKEEAWIKIITKPEYRELVDGASLIDLYF